eukprot:1161295-Pelagomonas_calceolata.AAC.20
MQAFKHYLRACSADPQQPTAYHSRHPHQTKHQTAQQHKQPQQGATDHITPPQHLANRESTYPSSSVAVRSSALLITLLSPDSWQAQTKHPAHPKK